MTKIKFIGTTFLIPGMVFMVLIFSISGNLCAQWSISIVDSVYISGSSTSIALDSNNYPHIAYSSFGSTCGSLKYAVWTGSIWETYTVDYADQTGAYCSLVLDCNEYPHISYASRIDCTGDPVLKYVYWNGTYWDKEVVDSEADGWGGTSLALDSNEYPHISYYDINNKNLKYARWTGSAWDIQTVDWGGMGGKVGKFSSLALDGNDYPHISYYDEENTALKYVKWTGSTWDIQTVDDWAWQYGQYTSLALDSNDYPHISYHLDFYSDPIDTIEDGVAYARWTGTDWEIHWLDWDPVYSGIGLGTSIALDNADVPHISYCGLGDLRYAKYLGSYNWDFETVEPGLSGLDPSIALDSSNSVHISYFVRPDISNHPLKYAYRTAPLAPEINVRFRNINFPDETTRYLGTRSSSFIMGRDFTFTIENLGSEQLNLTGSQRVYLSGGHAAHFQITQQPTTPVSPAGSTTFVLRTVRDSLPPGLPVGWEYPVSFDVNIPNDDSDENPYNFTIEFILKK
jgi:hypothetical protein